MVQLARHYGTGPASLAGIAAEEDLPRAYLEQLVVSLREAGLVVSTRGAHGGYELVASPRGDHDERGPARARRPDRPDVLRHGRPEHALVCDRSSRCTVNLLWVRVRDAITSTLESMTLADLAPERVIAARRRPDARRPTTRRSPDPTVTDQTKQPTDNDLVIRDLRVAPAAKPDRTSSRAST